MNERFRSVTMRIHQQEESLLELTKKIEANKAMQKAEPINPSPKAAKASEPDVESAVKLQMLEHRLNGM